jgi:prevent-host-death family protein
MKKNDYIITATELKSNLGKYLDLASDNNKVVITKNGRKIIQLTPYTTDAENCLTLKEKALDYQYSGKKVSYAEFMEIYENTEARMEFINGEIILLSSPSTFHQDISGNLYMILRSFLKDKPCKVFYAPFDVHFHKQNIEEPDVMQPDLLIACDLEDNVTEKGRYTGTPSLVVEILSPSTRSRDMVDKLNTYMLSGVKEFWIVDQENQSVLVYGFKNFQIDAFNIFKKEEVLKSYYFKGFEVSINKIFG